MRRNLSGGFTKRQAAQEINLLVGHGPTFWGLILAAHCLVGLFPYGRILSGLVFFSQMSAIAMVDFPPHMQCYRRS